MSETTTTGRSFLTIASLLLTCTCSAFAEDAALKPNVVVILADDLGYGDLHCYGAEKIPTPHCDRLAHEGMRFTDAHSPSAVCSPTRYGVLTGRYGWRSWLKNWVLLEHMPLLIETDRLTLPAMFEKKGYVTGGVGKWHLGWGREIETDFNGEVTPGPCEVGFDYFFGVPFSHNSSPRLQVFIENRRIVGLKPGEAIDEVAVQQRVMRRLEDTAIKLSEAAVQFIERNQERPFFLYYPTTNIHFPITPNERFRGKSQAGIYGDFVVEFDWAVGQVLATLDRLGLTENTLVILTSDNGARPHPDMRGHRPNGDLRGTKRQIYEGGHRVPLIARWPGRIKPGSLSDETVCLTDLMATCAAVVEYQLPNGAAEDSYNMLPVLLGHDVQHPVREATLHHSITGMFAIRQGRWKLIDGFGNGDAGDFGAAGASGKGRPVRDPQTGQFRDLLYDFGPLPQPATGLDKLGQPPGQLYDLQADPQETRNLWNEKPEVVAHLQQLLQRYKEKGRN